MGWLFGENFELYIRNEVEELILSLEVQLLLGERWKLRVDANIETYWEIISDNGQTYEIRRMPEICITHKENNDESEISELSINVITELKYLSVLDEVNMEEIEEKNEDDNLINIFNNNNAQIPSKNQNNELSGMAAQFEPLSDTDEFAKLDQQLEEMKTIKMEESQKSLMEQVEALKKEVMEMKELKTNRKRKVIKTRGEGAEKAEKKEKKVEKETEQKSSEKAQKEENSPKKEDPEITVLERENRIRMDDEISLNLELEEEERILFSTPRGAENEKMSYWQSCLNRVKSHGELEKGLIGKMKKPTDPMRVAKSEIQSAELNIWQKRPEEIPPEGKRINQFDCNTETEREEKRKEIEFGKANWWKEHLNWKKNEEKEVRFGTNTTSAGQNLKETTDADAYIGMKVEEDGRIRVEHVVGAEEEDNGTTATNGAHQHRSRRRTFRRWPAGVKRKN
ncbi:hypothetical protein GPALN_006570 [Globodera pallida]|nr:hypothetical protein GPALN_006570 [Globodera pallida]